MLNNDEITLTDAPDELDRELAEVDDLELSTESDDTPVVYEDEMADNLVPTLALTRDGRKFLKKTCSSIVEWTEAALDGTDGYRQECAKVLKLFLGDIPKKNFPFEDSANIHVPIVLENTLLIACQSWSELFPNWEAVFSVMPMGNSEEDEKIAEALTIHGNWQLREQITGFKVEIFRGLLMFYLFGDLTCHSYYDDLAEMNCHEMLTADDFVTPYSRKSVKPDYSDLPWYCKRLWYQEHELEHKRGVWEDVDAVLEKKGASWDSDYEPVMSVTANTSSGIDQPDDDEKAPYEIYQWEGWLTLPEMEGQRWCQVIVEPKTRIVLKLCIYEEENWQDRARYNMELQQKEDFVVAQGQFAMAQSQMEQAQMGAQMGDPAAMMQMQEMAMQSPPEPPVPPEWMMGSVNPETGEPDPNAEPVAPRMQPIRLFTHGINIEPIAGNLGIGQGRGQAHHNRTANTLYNQFVDAGTLANCHTLVKTESVEFERPFSVGPGKVNTVRGVGPNLSQHLMPLSFPGANPQLAEMADRVYSYAKGAAQANDVLAGDPGKSGEPAKLHQARLAQATKMIAVPAEKFREFFCHILKNNAKLNAVHLREEELYWVANAVTKHLDQKMVKRSWYDRSYRVEIRADLTFEGKEARVAQADGAAGLVMQNPITAGDAGVNYLALKRQLEARGLYDMVAALPPPPVKGMPMGMYLQSLALGPPGLAQSMGMQPPGGAPPPGGGEQPPPGGQVDPNGGGPPQKPMPPGPPAN